MDTVRTLAGWVLFLMMAVVAAFFWYQSNEQRKYAGTLNDTIKVMEARIGALSENVALLEAQVETAAQTIAKLRAKMEISDAADASDASGDAANADTLLGMTLGEMLDTLLSEDAQSDENATAQGNIIKEMLQGHQGEQMLEMGTRMTLDMQFGDFFDMLAPDAVDAVKEILGDYMIHAARISIGILGEDADIESAAAAMESMRGTMLTELRGVLGEDGVAMYEQYERELPGRMMDQALEMQLGMFARELNPETRDLVRHTVVEELIASQPENMTRAPTPQAMQQGMQLQDEAYERALERLTPQLTEAEYDIVERFVRQQQQMMSTFGSMMGL